MMIIVMMNNDDDDDDECWLMSDGNGAFMGTLEPGSRLFSGKIKKNTTNSEKYSKGSELWKIWRSSKIFGKLVVKPHLVLVKEFGKKIE